MKYVALLSGGKDSCFNLLHCHINGHELVAAASLRPPDGTDELDSFMYQTVGHEVVQLVADALGVPLYRRTIQGRPVEQGLEYGPRSSVGSLAVPGDETEDMYELLVHIKQIHPEIQAVSAGAILSNYQRIRVEQVCNRLSLTPLCYLWERNQEELLHEMVTAGLNAIIIKVAGIGLNRRHIGMSLSQMQPHLLKLNALYGSHVCGEGGEYETLTLDSPLHKRKLELHSTKVIVHSDHDFASVFYLQIEAASLQEKTWESQALLLRAPALLEERWSKLLPVIRNQILSANLLEGPRRGIGRIEPSSQSIPVAITVRGNWSCISNLSSTDDAGNETAENELRRCLMIASELLVANGSSLDHVAFVNLFISSMELFPAINRAYGQFFYSSPPARVCLATSLPPNQRIRMELLAFSPLSAGQASMSRDSLHVQSLSYWAPANIGPYSQALSIGQHTFISGQIGLLPASNLMPIPPDLATEACLSLQHVLRIKQAVSSRKPSNDSSLLLLCLIWVTSWKDAKGMAAVWKETAADEVENLFNIPTAFLSIGALPKAALVEAQVVVSSGVKSYSTDGLKDGGLIRSFHHVGNVDSEPGYELYWEVVSLPNEDSTATLVFIDLSHGAICSESCIISWRMQSALSIRLFAAAEVGSLIRFIGGLFKNQKPPLTHVPVDHILDRNGREWPFVISLLNM